MGEGRGETTRREQETKLWRLYGQIPELISDLLFGAILVEEHYGELAAELERLAVAEARIFRLWGAALLRNGADVPLRRLIGGRSAALRCLSREREEGVEAVLSDLRGRMEYLCREVSLLLTSPSWESEDSSEEILTVQKEQLRRLEQLFS